MNLGAAKFERKKERKKEALMLKCDFFSFGLQRKKMYEFKIIEEKERKKERSFYAKVWLFSFCLQRKKSISLK